MPKYLADKGGNLIKDHRGNPIHFDDVETDNMGRPLVDDKGKPIFKPYSKTEGKRIWDRLMALRDSKADKPLPKLTPAQENQLVNAPTNTVERLNMLNDLLGDTNTKQTKVSDKELIETHVEKSFSGQYDEYQKQVDKEVEEYKDNFMVLSEKLAKQEETLQDALTTFNNEKDAKKKIELFTKVNEEMKKLQEITENFGKAIQNTNTEEVVDALSSYDYGYDEDTKRKVIKNL